MNKQLAEKIGLIFLSGAILGSSVVMTRMGVSEIPPLALVFLRLSAAAIAFALMLIAIKPNLPREARTWRDIAIVGVTNAGIPLICFTLALQFISSAVLTIFIALVPLFTGLMAHRWLTQEKLDRWKISGMLVAMLGVLALVVTGTTGLVTTAGFDVRGQILALVGVIVGAFSGVYTRLKLRNVDTYLVTAGQFGFGLLLVIPFAFFSTPVNWAAISIRGWFSVFYSGLVGSFAGFLLVFYMIKRYGPTQATLGTYIMPAVSAGLGVLILGEVITLPLIFGAGLIILGVFLASR